MARPIFLLFFLFLFIIGNAQEKNEIEKRIEKNDVPEKAKEWLKDAYDQKRKTKWYYQTDGKKKVYEAKLKHNDHLHSVEFNMGGSVRNIEITIDEDEILEEVKQAIFDYLNSSFVKHRIKKIQIQYTGNEDDLKDFIGEDEMEGLTINYEIEYYGKSSTQDELWEGLFDNKGQLLEQRVIILEATDNLDY